MYILLIHIFFYLAAAWVYFTHPYNNILPLHKIYVYTVVNIYV